MQKLPTAFVLTFKQYPTVHVWIYISYIHPLLLSLCLFLFLVLNLFHPNYISCLYFSGDTFDWGRRSSVPCVSCDHWRVQQEDIPYSPSYLTYGFHGSMSCGYHNLRVLFCFPLVFVAVSYDCLLTAACRVYINNKGVYFSPLLFFGGCSDCLLAPG